jgi:hypothetical protein
MRHFFDRLQLWLYLAGFARLAKVVGHLGSPPVEIQELPEEERITWPNLEPGERVQILNFDPTFNTPGIDASDIAWPKSKLDIN